MNKIYERGYITYKGKDFTFIYEENKLTMINTKQDFTFFGENLEIDYFKGFTIDNKDVLFYINGNINYINGVFICYPRIVFKSRTNEENQFENDFDSICFVGGVINRFYTNKNLIKLNIDKYHLGNSERFEIKTLEETTKKEQCNIDDIPVILELGFIMPGWKDDGSITFNNYDSLLRIAYSKPQKYNGILSNILSIEKLLKFCSNSCNITVENIYIQKKNSNGKYERKIDIFIPSFIDGIVPQCTLSSNIFELKFNSFFDVLKKQDYIFANIPLNHNEYKYISNKDVVANLSCFQSLYQLVCSEVNDCEYKDDNLENVKTKSLNELEKLFSEFSGKQKKYLKSFINTIAKSDLKLEKQLSKILKGNTYLLDNVYYGSKDYFSEDNINNICEDIVNVRDAITHNGIVKLTNENVEMYYIIYKMNFVLLLLLSGIEKEKIKMEIKHLSNYKIL